MAMKLFVLSVVLVACSAGPVWIDGDETFPGVILRVGRSPNMAYGFGSSFSSNIGGIAHSTSIGSSFQDGDAEAYGAGVAGHNVYARSPGSNAYAKAVGVAHSNADPIIYSAPHPYQLSSATAYNNGYAHNVNSAASQAQNFGDYSSAISSAQNLNGYGSAGLPHYQAAVASAKNAGLGYFARNGLGYNSAASSAHGNGLGYNAAVSAAENVGGYGGSSSQAIQQRAGYVQNSGASSINGPGLQAAQSHAVNADLF